MSPFFRKALIIPALLAVALAAGACNTTASVARRAAGGDPRAQFEYGRRLVTGQRAPKDPARALVWFHTSAAMGNPKAMAAIGFCHEQGLGTPADAAKAREWYQRGADAGSDDAMFALAGMDLKSGNTKRAYATLEQLSKRRNRKATDLLIKRYMKPTSPFYDPVKGVDFLRYAALDGSADAARALSYCYANGVGVPKNPLLAEGWKKWK